MFFFKITSTAFKSLEMSRKIKNQKMGEKKRGYTHVYRGELWWSGKPVGLCTADCGWDARIRFCLSPFLWGGCMSINGNEIRMKKKNYKRKERERCPFWYVYTLPLTKLFLFIFFVWFSYSPMERKRRDKRRRIPAIEEGEREAP